MESTADLLLALAMLAAILTAFCGPIVWYATRPGQTRQSATLIAEQYKLAAQPSPHARMLFFAGTVDGFRMEAATAVNLFDRHPPTVMRSAFVRNLVIRVFLPEPFGPPFTLDNAYGSLTDFDPAGFGLHPKYRVRAANPDWLKQLLAHEELTALLNGFVEPGGHRRFVVVLVNEHGAVGMLGDPTAASAADAAAKLLRLMQVLRSMPGCETNRAEATPLHCS
jgi:hypothetical protein